MQNCRICDADKVFQSLRSPHVFGGSEKHKRTNQDQVKRRIPFFKDYLKKNVDLQEIGCSSGFMMDAFKEKGVNCIRVEASGEFGDFLKQSGHTVVQDISQIEKGVSNLVESEKISKA